jgi:Ca2+-binding EF-hand superfamily protein
MGLNLKREMRRNVPIYFTREEMSYYMKYFRQIDVENKGFLTLNDIKRYLQVNSFHRKENAYFLFLRCQIMKYPMMN